VKKVVKVLLVNTYDLRGGAARATWRIFKGLQDRGINTRLMVQTKLSNDPDVIVPGGTIAQSVSFLRPYIDFIIPFFYIRKRAVFSPSLLPGHAVAKINELDLDIIHLNWITGGFIRIESLAEIQKPVVWTLHDMWAFTGGCHYALTCDRFKDNCGHCPQLHSSHDYDLSRKIFRRKLAVYKRIQKLTIVTPSQWLASCVRSSRLLGNFRVEAIPNGLDTSVFVPVNKTLARQHLHLPENIKMLLFGGIRADKNKLKGFDYLIEALSKIKSRDIELMVFGAAESKKIHSLGFKAHFWGTVNDDRLLIDLYSAANVTVVPSLQEVFGQTASEAMACGTPVAAFGITGLLDIVTHKVNGYLAKPYSTDDLAEGIDWILGDQERYKELAGNARKSAVANFDIKKIADRMIHLYEEVR